MLSLPDIYRPAQAVISLFIANPGLKRYTFSMSFLKRNGFFLLAVAAAVLFSGGCAYNVSYLVKNSQLSDIETVFKDYAGLSGYNMTYADDRTGAYRIVVNSAIVATGPQGEHQHQQIERQVASLAVQLAQEGKDVSINAQSTGNLDASDQFKAFIDYLQGKGYTVQEIKQNN